jgi:parvulin-like peptidyl-prolyl isomerase
LEGYYQGHREQFVLPEQVRLRQILVHVDPEGSSEDWDKAHRRALQLLEKAKRGRDFAELAREFSDDEQTKGEGGDIGFVHRGQMRVGPLEERAYSLGVGEISEPIRTLYGYFIIRIEGRKPQRQLEFKEVNRTLLRNELLRSAVVKRKEEWLKGLRERAEIKIFGSQ